MWSRSFYKEGRKAGRSDDLMGRALAWRGSGMAGVALGLSWTRRQSNHEHQEHHV